MNVSETKKLFDQYFELAFLKNDRLRRYLKIIALVGASVLKIIFLLSMALGLVFDERNNFSEATITFAGILGQSALILVHWQLFMNRKRYYTLLNDMKQIVNDKCK